jgi:hypothetical protein
MTTDPTAREIATLRQVMAAAQTRIDTLEAQQQEGHRIDAPCDATSTGQRLLPKE